MNGEKALKVFKKYGFNSTNSSPYLCSIGNRIGVSFKYNDNRFGLIERSTFFDNLNELDTFLKLYRNYLDNAKSEHIYMLLDNYQVMFPNLIYAEDDKAVLNDEMVYKTKNKDDLSELEKLKLVASNLLSYYVDVSSRQVKHINNVSFMKNILLKKENELKNEIRKLSKKKEEEKITTIKTEYFQYDNSLYSSYNENKGLINMISNGDAAKQYEEAINSATMAKTDLENKLSSVNAGISGLEQGEALGVLTEEQKAQLDNLRKQKIQLEAGIKQYAEGIAKAESDMASLPLKAAALEGANQAIEKVLMGSGSELKTDSKIAINYNFFLNSIKPSEIF